MIKIPTLSVLTDYLSGSMMAKMSGFKYVEKGSTAKCNLTYEENTEHDTYEDHFVILNVVMQTVKDGWILYPVRRYGSSPNAKINKLNEHITSHFLHRS